MAELKQCPFCGRIPKVEDCGTNRFFVKCECGIAQDKLYFQRCDAIRRWNTRKATNDELCDLPSAQPERKKGRWIDLDSDTEKYDDVVCSNCKQIFTVDAHRWFDIGITVDDLKFCPNCGADMRGE